MSKKIAIQPAASTTDTLTWNNPAGGAWGTVGNWFDTTAAAAATASPTATNAVVINGGTSDFTDITGNGAAASLTVSNDVLLWGTVAVGGAVTLMAPSSAGNYTQTDFELDGAAKLTAASLLGTSATMEVSGGSAVTVSGTAQLSGGFVVVAGASSMQLGALQGGSANVMLFNGGKLTTGSLVLNNNFGASLSIDSSSTLEVGSVGGAAAGALTVDAGRSATLGGTLAANVVAKGTLAVQAGGYLTVSGGTVSGAGTLSISENARLSLGADSAAIAFAGPGGTLLLSTAPTGAITGFTNGDSINVSFANAVTAAIGASSTVLTLKQNGVSAGTIALMGNYAGDQFHLSFQPYGGGVITLRTPGVTPTQPTTITGTPGKDTLKPTANGQTLTGLGGGDTFNAAGFTGITFKDISANLDGSTISNADPSDVLDLTDMNAGTAALTFSLGTLSVSDGTHSAVITLSGGGQTGFFTASGDGAGGTKLVFTAVQTSATGNNQTLGALGGAETLYGNGYTGIDFKATSAKLTGATLQGFNASDTIDVTDLALASATLTYTPASYNYGTGTTSPGTLSIGSATVYFPYQFSSFLPTGYFSTASDGSGGTNVTYVTVQTSASANNQILGGVGGVETLYGNGYTGIDFKGPTARMTLATLSGFTSSDTIDITDMALASATVSFTPPYYTGFPTYQSVPGSMTIADGTHTVTLSFPYGLTLPKGYFTTANDGAGGTNVTYLTVNTDAYAFANTLGGGWATAGNWTDTTAGATATIAPSYGNDVTIAGGASFLNVTGSGVAASLTTSGDVLLWGTVALGTKVAGVSGNLTQGGTLALDGGAALTATGTAVLSGYLEVGGASKVSGASVLFQTGSALMAVGAGTVQFGAVAFSSFNYPQSGASTIGADAASSIEFGTTGGAAKGAVTVDGGQTVELLGTVEGNVVVNGTLQAYNALTIASFGGVGGAVSGSGTLAILQGATLTLGGGDSAAILLGANATLGLNGALPTGTISGFATGGTITLNRTVTSLSYSQGATTGTLTLKNGATTIGALTLAGTYAAGQFQLQTNGAGESASILYSPTPSTTPGTQVSSTSDTFNWTNFNGGVWGYAGNWTVNGSAATVAPGANNAVYINNGTAGAPLIISGAGSAASIRVYVQTDFTGTVTTSGDFFVGAATWITGSAVVSAGSLDISNGFGSSGSLDVGGTGHLTVTGTASVVGVLAAVSGAVVRIGGQGGSSSIGAFPYEAGTVADDSTSTIEFGAAGSAAAGAITVDAGQTVVLLRGIIAGSLVVSGALSVSSGTIEGFGGGSGAVTGGGAINLGSQADLVLNATDSAAIAFGSSATLELMSSLPTGTLSGFAAGDMIQFDQTVTGASFNAGTGKLTLTKGATSLGTLTFAGSFTGKLFHLDVNAATGVSTLTLQSATTATAFTNNAATISGSTTSGTYTPVAVSGTAASLATSGNVLLTGTATVTGQITLAAASPSPRLVLDSAAKLTAASLSDAGVVQVAQGSSLTLSKGATFNGGSLLVLGGSAVGMKGLIGNNGTLAIDANSSISFGTIPSPVAGALNLSSSASGAFSGAIFGSIVIPGGGVLAVEAGASLMIDMIGTAEADPYGTPTIGGGGQFQIAEGATLGLGVASADQVKFTGPNGTLVLAALPTASIYGFTQGDSIVVDQTVTGLVASNNGSGAESLKLTNGGATVGTLTLAFTPAAGQQFHLDVAPGGGSATITLQSAGIAATQPTLINGTIGTDLLYATANGQTLTGLGGNDTLSGGQFTGIDFKDTAANLNGSAIQNFATSDVIDLTDVASASPTLTFTGGVLSVSDGTHSAAISLGFLSTPSSGSFHTASDSASGTLVTWH